MDYNKILKEIEEELQPSKGIGANATYIPELAKVDPDVFGLYLDPIHGNEYGVGDFDKRFSIQSIVKVPAVAMAFRMIGDRVWDRVGVEPSGDPFNSLVQIENENGIPRNPLINAGALVVADILYSLLDNPKQDFLRFMRRLANNETIQYNQDVVASEKAHGYRNRATINLIKSYGNIENDEQEVLDFYYHQCSIEMSCQQLAYTFMPLANGGFLQHSKDRILTGSQAKRINALMQTCGFYDEAGEFTFKVGLPGKSGVGGGIIAVCPGEFTVGVWSPRLNTKGNSVMGMKALELLTTKTGFSIF
ncbi:glutaminase [Roseivirga sp. BDSF3-8]|uniref:glutaminase n=1 Tax=Roseivirga sp. BDSF3-8 TaxID=3241598 RepID=UPI0035318C45